MKFFRFQSISFRYLSLLVILFFVYTFAGKFGLSLAYVNASATAVWPPTGIAIAAILIFGLRVWPAIFLGAFVVNLTTQGNIPTSIGIALGNTLEGIVAAYLITRFAHGKNAFDHVIDVSKFTGCVLLATMVSATIGVITLTLGGYVQLHDFWQIWMTWWFGDIGGGMIVVPVIIAFGIHEIRTSFHINIVKILYAVLFFGFVLLIAQSIFSGKFPFEYFVFPILVWGAFRFGRREVTVSVLLISLIAVWNTIHGLGPFALPHDINRSLLRIAFFLSTTSFTMMAISAALLERKESRTALSASEKRFQSLIEKSYDAIVLIDATSKILYVSPSFERVLGYKAQEVEGTIGFNLVHPQDRDVTVRELAKLALKPGGTVTIEYRTLKKDGSIIWVEATGTNLLMDSAVGAIVVNFHDITQRKLDLEHLALEKAEDDALLGSIGEGILATDNMGTITVVNTIACDMLGFSQKELYGKKLPDIITMQDGEGRTIPMSERPISKVFASGKRIITSPHNYYVRKDKTKFPVRFTIAPILLKKRVIGSVEVFRDITHEIEVDRAKSEFVSLASHQLRTPLTTINWYIERLVGEKVGSLPEGQKTYLQEIYHASRRMVDLVNELLNVSRLELGTFIAQPEKVFFRQLVLNVLEDIKGAIEKKQVTITTNIPSDASFSADPKLLTIVVQNLLTNAILYSKDKGTVTIDLSSDTKGYSLSVKDTGYGIPQKDQKRIFTKLFRADNAVGIHHEGTGLGLYIVKLIVDVTGGKISFESKENVGTTFTLWYSVSGMKKKVGTKELR